MTEGRHFKVFMALECADCVLLGLPMVLFFPLVLRSRVPMLCGTLLWLVNNRLAGSVGGSPLKACLVATNLWTMDRAWRPARVRTTAVGPFRGLGLRHGLPVEAQGLGAREGAP